MDEEKQLQPHSRGRRHILLRLLRPINAILIVLTLSLSLFILVDALLPHFGILLNFNTHGSSMEPTVKGNAFVVISTSTPFEDLKVGDIILFKEPKGLNTATDRIKVHIHPVSSYASSSDPTDSSYSSDSSPDSVVQEGKNASENIYSLEDIEYLPDRTVLHRIVEIKDTSNISSDSSVSSKMDTGSGKIINTDETLLITQGDNNPYLDRYPVSSDAYLGKMLWHIDFIGEGINFLYRNFVVIIIFTVIITSCTVLIKRSANSTQPLQ